MIQRPDKIKKIRTDYNMAIKIGKDHNESIIYAVEQNASCTAAEFFMGIYPLHSLSLKPDSKNKQKELFGEVVFAGGKEMWRQDKHKIVKDPRFPDQRIISVRRKIQQLNGIIREFNAQGFAQGQDALNAIKPRKGVMKGILKEIADYEAKAKDKNLARRLAEAKRRREKEING